MVRDEQVRLLVRVRSTTSVTLPPAALTFVPSKLEVLGHATCVTSSVGEAS
jgi:hypothetical protein